MSLLTRSSSGCGSLHEPSALFTSETVPDRPIAVGGLQSWRRSLHLRIYVYHHAIYHHHTFQEKGPAYNTELVSSRIQASRFRPCD